MNKTYPSILDHYRSVIQDELRNDLLECYDEKFAPNNYENSDHTLSAAIWYGFDWIYAKKKSHNEWNEIYNKAIYNEIPCHPIQQVEKEAEPDLKERIKELEESLDFLKNYTKTLVKIIDTCPCDPDITQDNIEAWAEHHSFVKLNGKDKIESLLNK